MFLLHIEIRNVGVEPLNVVGVGQGSLRILDGIDGVVNDISTVPDVPKAPLLQTLLFDDIFDSESRICVVDVSTIRIGGVAVSGLDVADIGDWRRNIVAMITKAKDAGNANRGCRCSFSERHGC